MKLLRAFVLLAVVATSLVIAGPAQAADGESYARVYSGEKSGGSTRSQINFTGKRSVEFTAFKVNDICPGDNKEAFGRWVVKFMDGSKKRGRWLPDQSPTCNGWGKNYGTKYVNTSKRIKGAWVQVKVGDKVRSGNHRDNGHTG